MFKFFSGMDTTTLVVACILGLLVLAVLIICGLLSLQEKERESQRLADEAYARQQARREEESEYDYRGVKKAPLALRDLMGVPNTFLTYEERQELVRRAMLALRN